MLSLLVLLATGLTAERASATTITVLGTEAFALGQQGALFATNTVNVGGTTATATADVLAGHLGALVSTTSPAGAGLVQDPWIFLTIAVNDAGPDDVLTMDMRFNGTFTSGGGTAYFEITDPTPVQTSAISCNTFNVNNYGVPCRAQVFGEPVFIGNTIQVTIPLNGVDTMSFQWLMDAGTTGIGTVDFLNSADFSLTVPNGTVILNNPGGRLFQTPSTASTVPEPGTLVLLGGGLILAARRLTAGRSRGTRE
jgi:hypothetical protein